MFCILRFFQNPDRENQNDLISRTLGKICFIDHRYRGPRPEPGEFWISDIVRETRHGRVEGCFLCEPWERVEYQSLVPLSPLSCTVNRPFHSVLTIDPVRNESPEGRIIPWIITRNHRQKLMTPDIVAVVVNLGGKWWQRR